MVGPTRMKPPGSVGPEHQVWIWARGFGGGVGGPLLGESIIGSKVFWWSRRKQRRTPPPSGHPPTQPDPIPQATGSPNFLGTSDVSSWKTPTGVGLASLLKINLGTTPFYRPLSKFWLESLFHWVPALPTPSQMSPVTRKKNSYDKKH